MLWSALLNDAEMLDRFITGNQRRLTDTFAYCAAFMRKHDIPFVEPTAAHFIWCACAPLSIYSGGRYVLTS